MERLEVDGESLEYTVRGSGEPVLLIHVGAFADGLYRPLAEQPALDAYRLISYHRRGYGGSTLGSPPIDIVRQASDAAALLEHLGVRPAHVVGHSIGGNITLQLAADRPDLIHSLALLEPALRMAPGGQESFQERVMPAVARYRAGDKRGGLDAFFSAVAGPDWQTVAERTVPGGVERAVADADAFFAIDLQSLQEWTFEPDQVAKITQPILSVVGARGTPFSTRGRLLLHSWFGQQVEDFDLGNVGHMLQIGNPEGMAWGLAEFFRRHPMRTTVKWQ